MKISILHFKRWIGMVAVSILIVASCSAPVKKGQGEKRKKEKDVADQLTIQNKQLKEKNESLSERLDALEKKQASTRLKYEERLKNMDKTISLLEQNLKDISERTARPSAVRPPETKSPDKPPMAPKKDSPPPGKRRETDSPSQGIIEEIITPEASKAIETVELLPLSTSKSKSKPESTIKKRPHKLSTGTKTAVSGSVKTASASKSNTEKTIQGWEDPDVDAPISPIRLKVVSGAKKKYQNAFKIYSSRNYSATIRKFSTFLTEYPNDQDADNSQFWIGQAYYELEDYIQAEYAFRKVLRSYEHGETRRGYKTPDAILMLGRIYLKRKKPIKARYYFQQVIKSFPDSRSAVKAKIEIQTINSY
ncbi:MAG: tol-pal system protein YbgF [Proteobacteria bacterium]|nr:tol-pal system protein YbgF [Pseudomonadota bacterium]